MECLADRFSEELTRRGCEEVKAPRESRISNVAFAYSISLSRNRKSHHNESSIELNVISLRRVTFALP